ncbi:hypothetical protein GTY73_31655 [Streptomyces sp. SID8354]|nr:hypothetical protein [Streptomyces sp. SID8354]
MREINESDRTDPAPRPARPPFTTLVRAAALALAAASTLAAALALLTPPSAAARTGALPRPAGDNCAYAGTAPPVHLPTDFPVPPGWHIPCTKPTPTPTPTPPPRPTPPPAPPPAPPPRPRPRVIPAAPTPRPAPPAPPVRRTPPAPPAPTPSPVQHLAAPVPTRPPGYTPTRARPHHTRSVVTRTLLVTTPAVLACAALRPRSRSASRSAGRGSS